MQGTPSGIPSLVLPNGGKLDLAQLKRHIPKYRINDEAILWWNSFIESCLDSPQQEDSWLFEDLLLLKQSVVEQESIPSNFLDLRAAETTSIPEVSTRGV